MTHGIDNRRDRRDRRTVRARSEAPRRAVGGFTLIELLVVIMIIVILAGLALPTIVNIKRQIARGRALATMILIDGAVKSYHSDYDDYPPSDPQIALDGYGMEVDGRYMLCQLLTGYAGDLGVAGRPRGDDANVPFFRDDGKAGWGFRATWRGPVHGPYNGAENVEMSDANADDPNGVTVPLHAFADNFGNEIYYYRRSGTDPCQPFDANHNAGGPDHVTDEAAPGNGPDERYYYYRDYTLRDYVRGTDAMNRDYVLMTKGPDGLWGSKDPADRKKKFFPHNPAIDDVTNFLKE